MATLKSADVSAQKIQAALDADPIYAQAKARGDAATMYSRMLEVGKPLGLTQHKHGFWNFKNDRPDALDLGGDRFVMDKSGQLVHSHDFRNALLEMGAAAALPLGAAALGGTAAAGGGAAAETTPSLAVGPAGVPAGMTTATMAGPPAIKSVLDKGKSVAKDAISLKDMLLPALVGGGLNLAGAALTPVPPQRKSFYDVPKTDPNYNYVNPTQAVGNSNRAIDDTLGAVAKRGFPTMKSVVPGPLASTSVPGLPFNIGGQGQSASNFAPDPNSMDLTALLASLKNRGNV